MKLTKKNEEFLKENEDYQKKIDIFQKKIENFSKKISNILEKLGDNENFYNTTLEEKIRKENELKLNINEYREILKKNIKFSIYNSGK